MSKDLPHDDPRLYNLAHLYSALRLTCSVYDRATNHPVKTATATGFVVHDRERRELWLVSNRHAFDPPFAEHEARPWAIGDIRIQGRAVTRGEETPIDFSLENPHPVFHRDADVDLAMIKLEADGVRGLHTVAYSTSEFVTRSEVLKDELGVGTSFVMPGYPSFQDVVGNSPILVPGLVSSDLRKDAEYGEAKYPGEGLCHAFSRAGMSGAPLLASVTRYRWSAEDDPKRELKILGVNRGHIDEPPYGMSTLSLFIPSWHLNEMFADAGNQSAALIQTLDKLSQKLEDEDRNDWVDDAEAEDREP